jgi:predicted  nucleic acid-binding Zn-ribbon protein
MAKFHDLIGQMRDPDGEGNVPDTIYDDLMNEYNTAFDGYQAHSQEKDAEITRLNSEVSRLKSANYDLLTQVGAADKSSNEIEEEVEEEVTISSLFKPRK